MRRSWAKKLKCPKLTRGFPLSISKFRENIINSGCGKVIAIVVGAVVLGGVVFTSCSRQQVASTVIGKDGKEIAVIAEFGGQKLTVADLAEKSKEIGQQFGGAELPSEFQIMMDGQALSQLLDQAAITEIARQEGVALDDESVLKSFDTEIVNEKKRIREQLVTMGKLKDGATEDDFKKAFKEVSQGQDLDEQITQARKTLADQLKDTEKRASLLAKLAPTLLQIKLRRSISVTDQDVTTYVTEFTAKRIVFLDSKEPGKAEERAKKVVAEVRGGLSFDDAINKYSDEPAEANKKKSDRTVLVSGAQIDFSAENKAVAKLKVGDVSEPVKTFEGYSIVKLISSTPKPPKDFDKQKEQIKAEIERGRLTSIIREKVEAFKKSNKPRFNLKGFEALYDFTMLATDSSDPKVVQTKRDDVLKRALEVAKSKNNVDQGVGAMVYYAGTKQKANNPEISRATILPELELSTKLMTEVKDSPELHLDLADIYREMKKGTEAGEQLLAAARLNTKHDPSGQALFQAIATKIGDFKKDKLITDEVAAAVDKEQNRWREENKKIEAERAKAEAEEKKAREAAEKQQKDYEAAQKKKPAVKKE